MGFAVETFAPPAWRERRCRPPACALRRSNAGATPAARRSWFCCTASVSGARRRGAADPAPRSVLPVSRVRLAGVRRQRASGGAVRSSVLRTRARPGRRRGGSRSFRAGRALSGAAASPRPLPVPTSSASRIWVLIAPAGFARTPRFLFYGLAARFRAVAVCAKTVTPLRDADAASRRRRSCGARPRALERTYQMFGDRSAREAYRRVYVGAVRTFAHRARLHAQWARYRGPVFLRLGPVRPLHLRRRFARRRPRLSAHPNADSPTQRPSADDRRTGTPRRSAAHVSGGVTPPRRSGKASRRAA